MIAMEGETVHVVLPGLLLIFDRATFETAVQRGKAWKRRQRQAQREAEAHAAAEAKRQATLRHTETHTKIY
jgi:hypothetical protein